MSKQTITTDVSTIENILSGEKCNNYDHHNIGNYRYQNKQIGGKPDNKNKKSNAVLSRYCDNGLVINNIEYKLEKIWRISKNDTSVDSKGYRYPYPSEGLVSEPEYDDIVSRIHLINKHLDLKKKYVKYEVSRDCLLCHKKAVSKKRYFYNKIMWEDGLIHYITVHKISLSSQFKKFILNEKSIMSKVEARQTIESNIDSTKKVPYVSRIIRDQKEYVMIERNQMLIMDALLIHGGYIKKYLDVKDNFNRYSEHAGFLDFDDMDLTKIIVSSKTNRVDEEDNEIYLPMGMDNTDDYQYIFHTHPPTPTPGGRAINGILYEFPSIGDIYHFIDHHNDGNVIGSLVLSSEGLYNIRKLSNDTESITINDSELYKQYQKIFKIIQKKAIIEYGTEFNTNTFYSTIAQNINHIKKLNKTLNNFNIHIDYYPRKKDSHGKWIIDTVFLIFRHNKKELTKK